MKEIPARKDDAAGADFIRTIIAKDVAQDRHRGIVCTRFPPEPNGYLHIGHAKSICLNFGVAAEYAGGRCNLRFDDSDPEKEGQEYVSAIIEDIRWLGFDWGERLFYASDYYDQLYDYATLLIKKGKAYVDDLTPEKLREYRGTLTSPGKESPSRNRSIAENLDLFERMRAGEFQQGSYFLRAKIDMASPNINMRDPAIYRIKKTRHYRLGDAWCIYPMYDFVHCICDALEGVTHSLCTLEFEDHRALYDWYLDQLPVPCHPQQIEFSRLQLEYTVTSKRKLDELVKIGYVDGWDDPRMPTISGMRRRGYTAAAIQDFCSRIGLTKNDTIIRMDVLESCVRADLNNIAPRVLAVLNPLKVVIDNYPDGQTETITAPYHPNRPEMGQRPLPFSKELYIERDDFIEDPPKKFFRLAPGREVRLRYAYFITCNEVIKNQEGEVIELRCSYDPKTRGGNAPDGRKVKGTLHWVSKQHALSASVCLYDRLFTVPLPEQEKQDWKTLLNPDVVKRINTAVIEPSLSVKNEKKHFQFERLGYFFLDYVDPDTKVLHFNRTVTLKERPWQNPKAT